jgi:hypothetical protein
VPNSGTLLQTSNLLPQKSFRRHDLDGKKSCQAKMDDSKSEIVVVALKQR